MTKTLSSFLPLGRDVFLGRLLDVSVSALSGTQGTSSLLPDFSHKNHRKKTDGEIHSSLTEPTCLSSNSSGVTPSPKLATAPPGPGRRGRTRKVGDFVL